MPHPNVTIYDLLLSCPNDVVDLKNVIDDCVKSFNATIGEINNVRIELKHWTTDSFSQSGDKPQNILNKQFIMNCDLCVALLGVRFGTPTDNYDSGTEEEIESMLAQDKQVFLYFIERNVDPSKIDIGQYGKVKKFKEKYAVKGVYSTVKTAEELRKEFLNALTMYFIKLVAPNTQEVEPKIAPSLDVLSVEMKNDVLSLGHSNLENIKLVNDKKEEILVKFSQIKDLQIELSQTPKKQVTSTVITDEEVGKMRLGDVLDGIKEGSIASEQCAKIFGNFAPILEKVEISKFDKELIQQFGDKYGVPIDEEFWELGNLQKKPQTILINIYGGQNTEYVGTESEKNKYQLIEELVCKIREFNELIEYFVKIDALYKASFFVENNGTTFDEDIDIRIYIEKGCVVKNNDIPQPGMLFVEEIVNCEAPKLLFAGYHDPEIDDYSNYPTLPYIPEVMSFPYNVDDDIKRQQEKYQDLIDSIFCYNIRENGSEDILSFNIPYLKQNTKMFFPSFLLFCKLPKSMRFEIRSKHSPSVYRKEFNVVKQNSESL